MCLYLISIHHRFYGFTRQVPVEAKVFHKSVDILWCKYNARKCLMYFEYVFHLSSPHDSHDPSTKAPNQSKFQQIWSTQPGSATAYGVSLESLGTPQPSEATARIKGSKALSSWPSMCQPASCIQLLGLGQQDHFRTQSKPSLQNNLASLQNTLLEHTHHGTGKGWGWGGVGQ